MYVAFQRETGGVRDGKRLRELHRFKNMGIVCLHRVQCKIHNSDTVKAKEAGSLSSRARQGRSKCKKSDYGCKEAEEMPEGERKISTKEKIVGYK